MTMDLRLNRKNQLPVHSQLRAQLVHLIQTGQLTEGTQLPTVRQLAGFLRVNRNTVSKVFSEMEKEGYLICQPGRGTFVSALKMESKMKTDQMQKLVAIVDEAVDRAQKLGFTPEEFSLTLYARIYTGSDQDRLPPLSALFIECNRPDLTVLSSELKKELGIRIDSLLVKDFIRVIEQEPESLRQYALVVTTFYHIREVKDL
ncbi:MAG: GntR family transcriptional regulator, partial [Deltaproteobacteria bacterium]|nr:GntR family transcriptional regulator [Deltaproteobacteria bacterium]